MIPTLIYSSDLLSGILSDIYSDMCSGPGARRMARIRENASPDELAQEAEKVDEDEGERGGGGEEEGVPSGKLT